MRLHRGFITAFATAAVLCAGAAAFAKSDHHRQLVRVTLRTPADLHDLVAQDFDLTENMRDTYVDVVADDADVARLVKSGFVYTVIDPDMVATLRREHTLDAGTLYPSIFSTYAEQLANMQAVHAAFPAITSDVVSIGKSLENRDIWGMKVSINPGFNDNDPNLPDVLFVGNHHAREPMSVEVPLDLIHQLTEGYGLNTEVTDIVNTKEVWFVPMLNVDGHVYCETVDDFWRKNRRNNGDGSVGVDLNRNYSYKWGFDNNGSSNIGSSDTYRGTAAFSEPETQRLRDFMAARSFTRAISYHSYGDLYIYPWGYQDIQCPDRLTFHTAGDSVTRSNGYANGTAWELLYNVNGEWTDYMYGETVAKPQCFAATIEIGAAFYPADSQVAGLIAENRAPALYWMRSAGVNDHTSASLVQSADNITIQRGNTLSFTYDVTNNTANTVTWKQWDEVVINGTKPANGNPIGGYKTLTLAPGEVRTLSVSRAIPSTINPTTFTWESKVAQFAPWPVLASDKMTVTITTAAPSKSRIGQPTNAVDDESWLTEEPAIAAATSGVSVSGRSVRFALNGAGAPATVRVVDLAGRLVGTAPVTVDGGHGRATWNGRTLSGAQAARGVYFVHTPAGAARIVLAQ